MRAYNWNAAGLHDKIREGGGGGVVYKNIQHPILASFSLVDLQDFFFQI